MNIINKDEIPVQYDFKCCHCLTLLGKLAKSDGGFAINSTISKVQIKFNNNHTSIQCVCPKCKKNTSISVENTTDSFSLRIKENGFSLPEHERKLYDIKT